MAAALLGSADGVERISRADVHGAADDRRGGVDIGVEVVDGEDLPVARRAEDHDFAVFARDVHLAVHANGRGVIVFERPAEPALFDDLARLGVEARCDAAAAEQIHDAVVDQRRRNVGK